MKQIVLALIFALLTVSAYAVEPSEILPDPVQEGRAREISAELRCLVCQNQSIDDSDADLAGDLRLLVRERITAGDSNDEVIDYVVARYGEFVLLRPKFGFHTLVLWLAAPLIFVVGLLIAFMVLRARRTTEPGVKLTKDEQAMLATLAEGENDGGDQSHI